MTWRNSAACAVDTLMELPKSDQLFFGPGRPASDALQMCAGCPVRAECKNFAEKNRIPHGIYGGESGAARRERLGISEFEDQTGIIAFPDPVVEPEDWWLGWLGVA